jgi:hypothetical protein
MTGIAKELAGELQSLSDVYQKKVEQTEAQVKLIRGLHQDFELLNKSQALLLRKLEAEAKGKKAYAGAIDALAKGFVIGDPTGRMLENADKHMDQALRFLEGRPEFNTLFLKGTACRIKLFEEFGLSEQATCIKGNCTRFGVDYEQAWGKAPQDIDAYFQQVHELCQDVIPEGILCPFCIQVAHNDEGGLFLDKSCTKCGKELPPAIIEHVKSAFPGKWGRA